MDLFVMLGGGLFFVVSSLVGIRLLVAAARNRGLPELVLGCAFLIGGTIGGGLGAYVEIRGAAYSDSTRGLLMLAYAVSGLIGITLYNAFTWLVFRRGANWALGLTIGVFVAGLAIAGWYAVTGVFSGVARLPSQHLALILANAIGPIWATVEGLRYHRVMRRRVALEMADPVVTDRFLLWGLGGACASVIVLSGTAVTLVEPEHWLVAASMLCVGVLGTLASGFYALAFFPPESYCSWIRRRAAA